MRVLSWFFYMCSCGVAVAAAFFDFCTLGGKKIPFYGDTFQGIMGYVFIACAVIGFLCSFFNRKGFVFATAVAAAVAAGLKWGNLVIGTSLDGSGQRRADAAFNMESITNAEPVFQMGFWFMIGGAAAMLIFGFLYFVYAPDPSRY